MYQKRARSCIGWHDLLLAADWCGEIEMIFALLIDNLRFRKGLEIFTIGHSE